MVAGLAKIPRKMEWLVGLIDARAPKPKRGPYSGALEKRQEAAISN